MRVIGVYAIFFAVVWRGSAISIDEPTSGVVVGFLTAYGLLLSVETWLSRYKPICRLRYAQWAYLFLQSVSVIGLLIVSARGDVFALLFIPLSLDAVTFFGKQLGYLCIAIFSLALTTALLFSAVGWLFGLAMGILFSGMCFLFGGYSIQVCKAAAARDQNQRTYAELQSVHRELQKYTNNTIILTVERERNRLARDLHDSITQTVFSMNLAAQSARLLLEKDPSHALCLAQLLHLEELATNAAGEIQSLVTQLKPRTLVAADLPAALRQLAAERGARDGLQITVDFHGGADLSETEILELYSIVNEALTNVLKHSGVNQAHVRLSLDAGCSCLEIADHGCGFDPQTVAAQRGHLGLAGMAERAREIGWQLRVASNPHQGTRILVIQQPVEAAK